MSRFAVISLTDRAVERIKEIMENNPDAQGIHIGVKKGGCAGMEYTINLMKEPDGSFDIVEKDGARVFVGREAVLFLLGTQMDFETTTLRTGFVFNNPNQTSACGCGESVELTPVTMEILEQRRAQSA